MPDSAHTIPPYKYLTYLSTSERPKLEKKKTLNHHSKTRKKRKKNHKTKIKMSSTKVVSSAVPTLHLYSKPNKFSRNATSTISFTSHVANSRTISVRNPNPNRTRPETRIAAFYAPADTRESLYELLGITEETRNPSEIKKAYKQMARKCHPDVSPPDRVDEYTRKFIMVHEAYETLSDPQSRSLYDRELAGGFGFASSAGKSRRNHQGVDESGEWKSRWQSQLDELKRRDVKRGGMSWGARMRNQS